MKLEKILAVLLLGFMIGISSVKGLFFGKQTDQIRVADGSPDCRIGKSTGRMG